jgi:hypothetical protein
LFSAGGVYGGLVTTGAGASVVTGDELLLDGITIARIRIKIDTARNAIARFFLLKVTVSFFSGGEGGCGMNCSDIIFSFY